MKALLIAVSAVLSLAAAQAAFAEPKGGRVDLLATTEADGAGGLAELLAVCCQQ